ncbi:MAG: DHA2 family efflux MFS transporter permease subunit [Ectothiorhodospiraceae bacterium]|nr:DHA2 family efflux MFS transporter permease subunit [Chromatiales bacterium]MCP5153589.1 DHA2 family efflux MFS transporter permease subunit [Ectothiorhodospiraceae bacterium]
MTATTTDRAELSALRKVLVLVVVIMSSTLYGTTLLVVSTILPQMQGTMSATADEIAWVMTFNILATAIATPTTGWLATRFGRRQVMVWSLGGFTVSTFMCGAAGSLESLIVWRILQGAFGAPSTPLTQSILLDTFPRHQHGLVIGIFGFGVVIGPVIGPVLGGIMAELYSWRWAFYVLVPVGVISVFGLRLCLPPDPPSQQARLDWTGFLTLSIALGAVQLVLSRGQRLDWFESGEILLEAAVAAVALWIFVAHSLTAARPFLDPRHFLNRNYAIGLLLVTVYGMLNFTPMVLLPPLLREHAGFPDALVGVVVAGRGVGGAVGFLIAGFTSRLDPRIGMTVGFAMLLTAGFWLMHVNLEVTVHALAANALLQGLAIGAIWVPLTVVTFSTVAPPHLPETSAVFHLLRNLGSSFFISICVAEIVRSTGMNYSRLVEVITPFNELLSMPWTHGAWETDSVGGLARLAREIRRQSAMIGYLNAFGLYTAACAAALPLIMLLRRKR